MQDRPRASQWPLLMLVVLIPIALAWSCHRILTAAAPDCHGAQVAAVQSR